MRSEVGVIGLVTANLGISGIADFALKSEPIIHMLIGLSQILVAVVTAWYVIRRVKQLRREKDQK